MKRTYIALSLTTLLGMALTAAMLFDFYLPDQAATILACKQAISLCSEFSHTRLFTFFGLPAAAILFFFYTWSFLSLHLFRESGEDYWQTYIYISLPILVTSIVVHLFYLALMIVVKLFSLPLLLSFALTAAILTMVFLSYKSISKGERGTFLHALKRLPEAVSQNSDRKFSSGTFVYYSAILLLFVVSFSLFFSEKFADQRESQQKVIDYIQNFNKKPKLVTLPPQSPIVIGNKDAELTIHVFTDPLCGACRSFHRLEKEILDIFGDRININTYYYPLDSSCNKGMSSEMHPGACFASKLFYAAQEVGIYEEVIEAYYGNYKEHSKLVRAKGDISELASALVEDEEKQKLILAAYEKSSVNETLLAHIDYAEEIKLSATPTIVINGRMIEGFPRKEIFIELIKRELNK